MNPTASWPETGLAIIAGEDALPQRIAEARAASGLPYLVIAFRGYWQQWMEAHPHQHHEFERAGRLFRALAASNVTHLVFAGAMTRPHLRWWRLDFRGAILLARAVALMRRGDDAMLRGFATLFEREGFRVIGADEILGGEALAPAGALGAAAPSARDRQDAALAARIVAATGALDIGQGAVVANGICLAVEAIEGTDIMLARIAALPPERRAIAPPPAGVLFKAPKPGQDRRLDLPAIGPKTVAGLVKAGLRGIVVAAEGVVLLEEAATRAEADRAGIFIYGASAAELAEWSTS